MRLLRVGILVSLFTLSLPAQTGHVLYGEFSVDESQTEGKVPRTFMLVLRNTAESILARDTVSPGSQYRFRGISNGEYTIAVELGGREVARMPIYVMGLLGSYIRNDVRLGWKQIRAKVEAKLVHPLVYARSAEQQALFDNALRSAAEGDLQKAVEFLNRLLELDPKDFEAWTELGTLFFRQERYDQAGAAYTAALDSRPTYPLALLNFGKLCLARQEYSRAVEVLAKGLSESDPLPAFYYFLGEAHLGLKKGSQAVEYFREALQRDPVGMADAHLRLGALYHAGGYRSLAADQYSEYLKKRPDDPNRDKIEKYIRENGE